MAPNSPFGRCTLAALWLCARPLAASAATESVNPWQPVPGPWAGSPEVIGGYTGGCLGGALDLGAVEGDAFQLMRKSRQRYFAHPQLRAFIQRLAAHVQQNGFGKLLVGDQSQARGGPSTGGRASHRGRAGRSSKM